jgi:iron complex outermembrane receptor protein
MKRWPSLRSSLLFLGGITLGCSVALGGAEADERLTQLSLEELGNVQVTSVSKEPEEVRRTPAAVYVITQEDIRRSGATSIPEVLRLAPGVEVARIDSDHWSVAIRGFSSQFSKYVLVLIDGRSVYTPLYAGVYWDVQNVPLDDVDRIEVIRGPGGTIWGPNAVNGVINIITKSTKDTHGARVSVDGGNVDEAIGEVRYGGEIGKNLNYRVYGMGFQRGPERHLGEGSFDTWSQGQGGFRTDWTPRTNDSLTVQGDIYRGDDGDREGISFYSPPMETVVNWPSHVSGGDLETRWRHVLRPGSDIEVQASFDRTYRFSSQLGETRNTYALDFIHHLSLRSGHNIIWGLGAQLSPSDFIEVIPTVLFAPHHQTDRIWSGFAQDEIPLVADKLSLTIGTKLEDNNFSGFGVEPSGRLLWTPDRHQTFWAAFTRALRTPSRLDDDLQLTGYAENLNGYPVFLRVSSDPRFKPEVLLGYEAGYRTLIRPTVSLDLAAFHNDYQGLEGIGNPSIFYEDSPPPLRIVFDVPLANADHASSDGFEVGPDWQPRKWWRLNGSYAYLHIHAGGIDTGTASTLEGSSPRHQVVLGSSMDLPRHLEFDQTYRYVSGLPAQLVGGYSTADAQFAWHFMRHFELSLIGQNLFQPYHAEYANPTGVTVGIKRCVYAKVAWESAQK